MVMYNYHIMSAILQTCLMNKTEIKVNIDFKKTQTNVLKLTITLATH